MPLKRVSTFKDLNSDGLIEAALVGDVERVKQFIEQGSMINCYDKHLDLSPLLAAAEKGHVEIVKMLVKAGANINFTNDEAKSALALAIIQDKKDVIEYLKSINAPFVDDKSEALELYLNTRGIARAKEKEDPSADLLRRISNLDRVLSGQKPLEKDSKGKYVSAEVSLGGAAESKRAEGLSM